MLDARARATRLDVAEGLVRMVHAQRDSDLDIGAGQFAVAVADAPLLGGVTPLATTDRTERETGDRDYERQPFRADSPWNRPLAAGARRVDINSPVFDLAGHGMAVHPAANDREIIVARTVSFCWRPRRRSAGRGRPWPPAPTRFPSRWARNRCATTASRAERLGGKDPRTPEPESTCFGIVNRVLGYVEAEAFSFYVFPGLLRKDGRAHTVFPSRVPDGRPRGPRLG